MKKLSLTTEFVPRNQTASNGLDVSRFKEWVSRQMEMKFSDRIGALKRKWEFMANMTWTSAAKKSGYLISKPTGRDSVKIDLLKDFRESFVESCQQEIEGLDNTIKDLAATIPHSKSLLIHYAKFKEANFGEPAGGAILDLFTSYAIFEQREFLYRTDLVVLVPVFRDFCFLLISNLDKLSSVMADFKLSCLPESPAVPVEKAVSPNTKPEIAEKLAKHCLWHDFFILKDLMQCSIDFLKIKDRHCKSIYREYCSEFNCQKYHLTDNDLNFLGVWLQKTREFILKRVAAFKVLRLVLVDGENCLGPHLNELFEMGERSGHEQIYIIFGCRVTFDGISDYRLRDRVVVMPHFLKSKDAADVDYVRDATYWNEVLPADIDFILLTGDGFALGILSAIKVKRNCQWSRSAKGLGMGRWNVELKRLAEVRQTTGSIQKWTLTKPSRVADLILNRDDRFCCCLETNGLPCQNFRFSSLVTCEKHT